MSTEDKKTDKIQQEFKLVGLSKTKSATLLSLGGRDNFNSPLEITQDRFNALFDYFKKGGEWTGKERALIECDRIVDGIPVNPIVREISGL